MLQVLEPWLDSICLSVGRFCAFCFGIMASLAHKFGLVAEKFGEQNFRVLSEMRILRRRFYGLGF